MSTISITLWVCPECGDWEPGPQEQCANYNAHPLGDYPLLIETPMVPAPVPHVDPPDVDGRGSPFGI